MAQGKCALGRGITHELATRGLQGEGRRKSLPQLQAARVPSPYFFGFNFVAFLFFSFIFFLDFMRRKWRRFVVARQTLAKMLHGGTAAAATAAVAAATTWMDLV